MSHAMMGCAPQEEHGMRHDPAGAAIVIMLRSLKMPGMAHAVQDLLEQGLPAFEAAMPILSQLLKAEMAEREVRSVAYHMKAARFPAYKDLSGFDFSASEMREALVRQLHRCPRQRSRTVYGWLPRGKRFSVDAGMISVAAMYTASGLQHGGCAP
jgi:DNA replication protein DnaC